MKFTDEELSCILGAHAGGQMQRLGAKFPVLDKVCVLQAAFGYHGGVMPADLVYTNYYQPDIAHAFDSTYDPAWSVEEFLGWLREMELA